MPLTDRKFTRALAYATGTADRSGAILDMKQFEEVDVIVSFAAIAGGGVNRIRVDSDSDSAFGSAQEITGTQIDILDDDDGQVFVIHIAHVPERYIRLVVDKDTSNACAESAVYLQTRPGSMPQTSDVTDVLTTESHNWPIVGTGASASPSLSVSLSPSSSSSPSASPSSSASASDSPSASPSLSPSLSPSDSGSASPSVSVSLSPSASESPSASPSLSPSLSPSPS